MDTIGALVAGPRNGSGEGLMAISRDLGFAFVSRYEGAQGLALALARVRLCFVLCAETGDPGSHADILKGIRFSRSGAVRFLPVIYFCEAPRPEVIVSCINMGFDDVLTTPFKPDRVRERLGQQIGRSISYFETGSYFGPDRRRHSPEGGGPRRGGGLARRYDILRSAKAGISLLREERIDSRIEGRSA